MPRCAYCGSLILGRGVLEGEVRCCDAVCRQGWSRVVRSRQLPAELVRRKIEQVHRSPCPECGGEGPVEAFVGYTVWSAVLVTTWRQTPVVSCRACATRELLMSLAACFLVGWWGIPWGPPVTLVQILRNLLELGRRPDPERPSARLERMVRARLAGQRAGAARTPEV